MKLYKQYMDEKIVQRIPEEDILIELELVSVLTNIPIVSFFEDRKVWESLEQARLSDTTSFRTQHAYYYWVEDLKGEDLEGVYSELQREDLTESLRDEVDSDSDTLDYATALNICRDLLGDDLDGIQSSMEDGMYLGLIDDDGDLFGDLYGDD